MKPTKHALSKVERQSGQDENSLPITAQEALQLLQSAIGYLQLAGMAVQAQNTLQGLQLIIPGTCYSVNTDNTAASFRIGTPAPIDNGTFPRMPKSRL